MYYFVGLCVASLATYFNKNPKTIKRWINKYDSGDGVSRQINTDTVRRKFNIQQVDWVCALIDEHPLLYLDELQKRFKIRWRKTISCSHIHHILKVKGYTKKSIERRSIQVRMADVLRFTAEMSTYTWNFRNLVFLDEVSFDNRGMIRKRGYKSLRNKS
jgi:transposase